MSGVGLLRTPSTMLYGRGSVTEVGRLTAPHGTRVLVCTDGYLAGAHQAASVVEALGRADLDVCVLDAAVAELPLPAVESAIARAGVYQPDCIVGLGGGSSIDLAKLVAVGLSCELGLSSYYGESKVDRPVLPVVALPTTAGTGSEVTPVAVLSDPDIELKVGISSSALIPKVAICDPDLTLGAPREVTAFAGIDALAHAIEAYCAVAATDPAVATTRVFTGANQLTDGHALRAIHLLGSSLRDAVLDRLEAREQAMLGSLLAGLAFGTAGTAAAHAIQYPVGARTHTPHGLGVGLLLPYVMAAIAPACAHRLAEIAAALGEPREPQAAIDHVRRLGRDLGLPASLEEIGVRQDDLPAMARQACGIERLMRNSPRVLTAADIEQILLAAWRGDRPRAA